jgi:hypothetical protein
MAGDAPLLLIAVGLLLLLVAALARMPDALLFALLSLVCILLAWEADN